MKLTKKLIIEMIEEELRKGREADNLLKEIDGWWNPKEIIAMVESTWSSNSQYRKSGYKGNPTGFDAFFKDRYVGKNFRLEFLNWTRENQWRRKKYGMTIDAIAIAVTDILFNRHPELKELSNLGVNAPGSPTAKDKYSEHKFRADLMLLIKAVIDKNLNSQQVFVESIQKSIDALKGLQVNESDADKYKDMLDKMVGDSERLPVPGVRNKPTPKMPFRDRDMAAAVDSINKPSKRKK